MKTEGGSPGLGGRLRKVRTERGLSLRELGRLAGCSASLISQVERGQTAPSAGVIYGIANALEIPLEYLFGGGHSEDFPAPAADRPQTYGPPGAGSVTATRTRLREPPDVQASGSAPASGPALSSSATPIVQRHGDRRTIDLASGVRWERLTPQQDALVDFLEVVYAPYGRSTDTRSPIRHDGREYQLVLQGTLHADIGFETYVLEAGDSLAFDPTTPHQYRNMSGEEVRVISVVVHPQ
jgi:transcriptional regulator with XRE-family HTH domain/mannose-6-phosphate isomerase-like protein (cupin superfamily)